MNGRDLRFKGLGAVAAVIDPSRHLVQVLVQCAAHGDNEFLHAAAYGENRDAVVDGAAR